MYNAVRDTIDVGGHELELTKKFRDVARSGRAAIVIDDLASTDPWRPRGVEVRGRAEAITLPTALIRIHPERIVSWGLERRGSAGPVLGA
jgi:pyridoxamine 5'-phosphate oxidase family protein